ncbi:MAG: cation diffusion facilitator family transporter [Sulfurovaceae bacterium]|nr:cation diffusion facilitator family transporter [Sulfurovaceae bacterium]
MQSIIDKKVIIQKVILLNATLIISEIVAGIYSSSMALIADAFHNLGDVLALFITLVAIIYGAKKATETMTFGYIRAESMAAFINSIFLFITMIFIFIESVDRFFNPLNINAPVVIFVSSIALFINGFSTWLLGRKDIGHLHDNEHDHEDMNIKSAYFHMLGDAFVSLSVVIGGIIMYFYGFNKIDSLLSMIFSIYVMAITFPILKNSFLSLMDSNDHDIKNIEKLILRSDEILSIHDLHLYRPNSKESYGSVHIVLKNDLLLSEIEKVIESIRERVCKKGITHFIVQPESTNYNLNDISCHTH